MDSWWLILVLISATIHPLRDLTLKGVAHPVSAYAGVCLSWVLLSAAHTAVTKQGFVLPASVWPLVVISAVGLAAYYFGTQAALQRGNLSIYYPIVRSSPIVIVALSFLALGQSYSWPVMAGILLVLTGGMMIQKSPGGLLHDPRAFGLAVFAMLGSAAYSLSDAEAMRQVGAAPFLFWVYVLVSPMLMATLVWDARKMPFLFSSVVRGWVEAPGRILFAGVASYISYLLILRAFSIGADPASVSAARQASIPVSIVLAALVLREPRFLRRIGWSGLIASGIAIIALNQSVG